MVYRPRRDQDDGKPTEELILPRKRNYFDKNGLPRHPERSVYYDKVMNPYGVAPPGMPYMERREYSSLKLSTYIYIVVQ